MKRPIDDDTPGLARQLDHRALPPLNPSPAQRGRAGEGAADGRDAGESRDPLPYPPPLRGGGDSGAVVAGEWPRKADTPAAAYLAPPGEIGAAGQARLRSGRVLIAGVGGLGAPAALSLAAAGVGTIGLMDPDTVELSNLQRQIIHGMPTLGQAKVDSAAAAISARNPEVGVRLLPAAVTAENLPEVFRDFDFVIDATDGAAAKFLINDGAVATGTPYSHAGALGWIGQTMTVLPQRSACYRCLFPTLPDDELPSCESAGIVGAVVGAIGLVQATEALKYLLGFGALLANRLLTYDALAMRWRVVPVHPNRACPCCRAAVRPARDGATAPGA